MNQEANISLYGDGTGEDFPVLKAFQQYIDAEQAKARRRLLTVSIIFVVMLLAVVAIFSALVIKANDQTQALNDRLVEFAMKNPTRNYEEAKQAAIQELSVKTLNETVARLQKQLDDQDRKASEAAAKAAKELAAAKEAAATATAPAVDPRTQEAELKLQKALAQLKSEKQKLADEKKKLREEELEKYRREHYPEYYAKKEAATKAAKIQKERLYDDIEDEVDGISYYDDEDDEADIPVVIPKKSDKSPSKKTAKKPSAKSEKKIDLDDDDAIDYFKDADSYTIPVEVKGKSTSWRVPLD